jgi:hypothetical protein
MTNTVKEFENQTPSRGFVIKCVELPVATEGETQAEGEFPFL